MLTTFQTKDDVNPAYMMQPVATETLIAIAKGHLDAQALACAELAARGIGRNGKWVGFDRAKSDWL